MTEDLDFAREARFNRIPTRRFHCLLGHSIHVNIVPLEKSLYERETRAPKETWTNCKKCGRKCNARFSYCSDVCKRDAKKAIRKQSRRHTKRKGHARPKPASQIHYQPKKAPIPYASPPKNLSMAWV